MTVWESAREIQATIDQGRLVHVWKTVTAWGYRSPGDVSYCGIVLPADYDNHTLELFLAGGPQAGDVPCAECFERTGRVP